MRDPYKTEPGGNTKAAQLRVLDGDELPKPPVIVLLPRRNVFADTWASPADSGGLPGYMPGYALAAGGVEAVTIPANTTITFGLYLGYEWAQYKTALICVAGAGGSVGAFTGVGYYVDDESWTWASMRTGLVSATSAAAFISQTLTVGTPVAAHVMLSGDILLVQINNNSAGARDYEMRVTLYPS